MKTLLSKLFGIGVMVAVLTFACTPQPALSLAQSSLPRLEDPRVSDEELKSLAADNNAFALDLYHALPEADNLIFSPFSISLALAMTYAGARGETATQMATTLHYTLPGEDLHAAFSRLDLNLSTPAPTENNEASALRLHIANAVWAQENHPFLQEYLDLLATYYGAGIHLADFVTQAEAARKTINAWVADQTENKIKDLIPPGALDALTRMVLVNAIYFKADWLHPFDANATRKASFTLLDGSQVPVEMMTEGMHGIPYLRGENFQAVELPYASGTAAMDILVPDEGAFKEFEAALDLPMLETILEHMQPTSLQLGLPKFTYSGEFDLSAQLINLGMPLAFDAEGADFSGMDERGDLFIGKVLHKAFVAVDEKGTEAAAATAVIMMEAAAPFFEVTLTIDRPFIFLIRDLSSGQILFLGRVLNPAK